jgi:peptidyl-prolyl cis-trans isomerase C
MKQLSRLLIKGSLLSVSLLVLSGCDWNPFKKGTSKADAATTTEAGDSAVLCSINGKPVIKETDFMNNLNQMIQANQYFRGATAESLPKELQRKFFEQLVTQALIEAHANENDIEKHPAFIKAYQEADKQLKSALKVQVVEKEIYDGITVSDEEINKHFAENKDRFVKVPGGTLAAGVRFETEAAADAFLTKARNDIANFETLAKAAGDGKFRDFGRVSKESRGMQFEIVPAPIKDAVLAAPKAPHVEKVKAGKEFWVIKSWDKKNTELFELTEVKPHIEGMLKSNKFKDVLDARLKDIRSKMNVSVNEGFFTSKEPAGEKGDDEEVAKPHAAAAAA